jgi:GNAT superfamily N-acetyltransferase
MIFRFSRKWLLGALISVAGLSAGYAIYYRGVHAACATSGILDAEKERDLGFIVQAFKDDWYWLVAEGAVWSPQLMLETRAYPQDGLVRNNLTIKVGYEDCKPTGFTAYYMQSMYTGKVLFIYVVPEFRSKRWGRRLLDYAVNDLFKQGATRIELVTRTDNEASQRLYNRYGFKELRRYGPGFVEFFYDKPTEK